jgi:hypothetical protein
MERGDDEIGTVLENNHSAGIDDFNDHPDNAVNECD